MGCEAAIASEHYLDITTLWRGMHSNLFVTLLQSQSISTFRTSPIRLYSSIRLGWFFETNTIGLYDRHGQAIRFNRYRTRQSVTKKQVPQCTAGEDKDSVLALEKPRYADCVYLDSLLLDSRVVAWEDVVY